MTPDHARAIHRDRRPTPPVKRRCIRRDHRSLERAEDRRVEQRCSRSDSPRPHRHGRSVDRASCRRLCRAAPDHVHRPAGHRQPRRRGQARRAERRAGHWSSGRACFGHGRHLRGRVDHRRRWQSRCTTSTATKWRPERSEWAVKADRFAPSTRAPRSCRSTGIDPDPSLEPFGRHRRTGRPGDDPQPRSTGAPSHPRPRVAASD